MNTAYIGLGSNLDKPEQQLERALNTLWQLPQCSLQSCSSLYRSTAVGPGIQPDYLNAVAKMTTTLEPESLLLELQGIETAQGRTRNVHWGARTLDLDILLYGHFQLDTNILQLPHPRMTERNFVLYPLFEISPELTLPNGTPLTSLLARVDRGDLLQLDIKLPCGPA